MTRVIVGGRMRNLGGADVPACSSMSTFAGVLCVTKSVTCTGGTLRTTGAGSVAGTKRVLNGGIIRIFDDVDVIACGCMGTYADVLIIGVLTTCVTERTGTSRI